jgi:hypothetical protein
MTDAFRYWEQRAEELARTNVDRVRESAKSWGATVSTLLGLLGVIVVIAGPDSIRHLSVGAQVAVASLITIASILLSFAVVTTAWAAQGFPTRKRVLTGPELAAWNIEESETAARYLRIGRLTGFLAALAVIIAGLVSLWATSADARSESDDVMVRTDDGAVYCGSLIREDHVGLAVDTGDGSVSLLAGIANVQFVDGCP